MEQPLIWFTRAEALGDRKPSHMMNSMLALIPEGYEPGFLFKFLFMNRLPEGIRNQLVLIKTEQLRELAAFADQLWSANAATVAASPLTCSPHSPCIVCIRRRVTSPIDLCDWPPFFDWNRNLRSFRFSTGAAPMKPPAAAATAAASAAAVAAPPLTCNQSNPCSVCTGRREASPTGLRDWPPHFEWNHPPRSLRYLTGAAPMEPPAAAAASAVSAAAVATSTAATVAATTASTVAATLAASTAATAAATTASTVAATVAASTAATAAATTASTVAAALAASSAAIAAASTASTAAASAAASSAAAVAVSACRRRLSRRPQPHAAERYRRPPPTLSPPPAPVRRIPPRAT